MEYLNSEKTYYAVIAGANKVISCREVLNKINLFPVADSDTGNNLAATMNSIIREAEIYDSLKQTLESIAEAALLGAKGNSGIIFAQFINAVSKELTDENRLSVGDFTLSINKAVPHVYNSVSEPVEGTMLTVIKDWALEIDRVKENCNDFKELFRVSLIKLESSLNNTTNQLKVLKQAGVVDAGAKGFVKFIEGFWEFIKEGKINKEILLNDKDLDFISETAIAYKDSDYRYCTEALLSEVKISEIELKELLADIGDSLIIATTKERTKVHLHTSKPAEVFKRLRGQAIIERQKVDDMYLQYMVANERKYDIALVTDSIADLPKELIDKYQIHVININLIIDGSNYLDKLTITPDKFYSLLDDLDEHPSSSQPNLKQVKDLFSFLTDHYKSVIALSVSKKLSGTWNVMQQVANQFSEQGEDVTVIDSKLNSGAQGLVVLEAAEQIALGKGQQEVITYINDIIKRTKIYVSVDTLKYMVRGGRISNLKGVVGKLLNLKPIISLDETGAGIAFSKAFSKQGTTKKIKEVVNQLAKEKGIKRYSIVHAQDSKRAKDYAELFTKELGKKPDYLANISPVVGLNAGVGAVAISVITKN